MSVTKPNPPSQRRTYAGPRRPSRIKIAAVWFALLLGSFLFGMLIISPLLGAILAGREDDTKPTAPPSRTAPASRAPARTSSTPQRPSLHVEENPLKPPEAGAGIRLDAQEAEGQVHADDKVEPMSGSGQPAGAEAPSSNAAPPAEGAAGLSVETKPTLENPSPGAPTGTESTP